MDELAAGLLFSLVLVAILVGHCVTVLLTEVRDLLEDAATGRAAERGVAAMREARLTPDTTEAG